jgi:hypothetical protein
MGSRNGGISNESMTKLGTPIGAGPNCAIVSPGLVLAGEPSGLRRVGCSIFPRSLLWRSLAPFPFFACLPNRPLVRVPATFLLPALPSLVLPAPLVVVVEEPPPVVVVVEESPPVVVVLPPESPVVGTLYSEVSSAPLQPGSSRSTRPSPSLSERSEHSGSTPVVVVVSTCTSPDPRVIEVAVPAAIIASAAPRAMVTRSFLVIA